MLKTWEDQVKNRFASNTLANGIAEAKMIIQWAGDCIDKLEGDGL